MRKYLPLFEEVNEDVVQFVDEYMARDLDFEEEDYENEEEESEDDTIEETEEFPNKFPEEFPEEFTNKEIRGVSDEVLNFFEFWHGTPMLQDTVDTVNRDCIFMPIEDKANETAYRMLTGTVLGGKLLKKAGVDPRYTDDDRKYDDIKLSLGKLILSKYKFKQPIVQY